MNYDNPAKSLHTLLEDARSLDGGLSSRKCWSYILDTNEKNTSELLYKISKAMLLPQKTQKLMEHYYPDKKHYLSHWKQKVDSAFNNANLKEQWSSFTKNLDDHVLTYIEMTGDLLDHKIEKSGIAIEKIEEIQEKIQELINEVHETELPEGFKASLLDHLHEIKKSSEEYKISGYGPLLKSVESAIGKAAIDETYREQLKETNLGRKIGAIFNTVIQSINAADSAIKLADKSSKLLGLDSGS
ncbi:hypothetical protein [Chromohalobacter israelensis]|uniref:hypothetical protein n=1 Tax=Chromohalobacter israelensis TaxID=141390 RepID=UPI00265C5334|nr:hypothetical protein [Chromohalobacter salexigens]MDO0945904.1 hypothetical protein [Chromohalobacter salexigens]